jgi:hypothetical protein
MMAKRRGQFFVVLVLVAGVILISVLALMSSSEKDLPFFSFLPRELLVQKDVGVVGGSSEGGNFRHIFLGLVDLSSSREEPPIASEGGSVEVARGIVTGQEHEVSFGMVSSPLTATFRVDDTNNLGLLLLRLNGKLVWTGSPAPGETLSVSISNGTGDLLPEGNKLQFSSTSSGWRLWSPSYYRVSSIVIKQTVTKEPVYSDAFSISRDELSSFVLGRVVFTVSSATPDGIPISIRMNNATIWKGPASAGTLPLSIDFGSVVPLSDENTISFGLEGTGAASLSNSEVIIFTSGAGRGVPTVAFSMSRDDLSKLRADKMGGVIEFSVSEISSPGTLQVSLIGDREASIYSAEARAGKARVAFADGQVISGKNTLVFMSPNGGVFRVSDLSVRLEKA